MVKLNAFKLHKTRFVFFALVLLNAAADAKSIYKVADPDGTVHFSDRPPSNRNSATVLESLPESNPKNKNEPQQIDQPVSHNGDPYRDPILASLQVYYKQVIVETAGHFCVNLAAEQPDMAGVRDAKQETSRAQTDWRNRHWALIQKRNRVLHDLLSRTELDQVADNAKRENAPILQKIQRAPAEEKLKWCQNMASTFASAEFDLMQNTLLTDTIMTYKERPQ